MNNISPYHIKLKQKDIGEFILLTGDPNRTEIIARMFDSYTEVTDNREFKGYTGYITGYDGEKIKITTISTGIGSPAAAICVEELINIGGKVFIRIGTAGSLQPNIKVGDIVISTGSVREEGTSKQYIPEIYPAVADFQVVNALIEAAKKLKIRYHVGITHSKDAFYSELPGITPIKELNEQKWKFWQRSNVLATDMETSVLFVIGSIRKVYMGSIVKIVGNTYSKKPIIKSLNMEDVIKVAIESIKILKKVLQL